MFQFLVETPAAAPASHPAPTSVLTGASLAGLIVVTVLLLTLIVFVIYRLVRALRRPELYGMNREAVKETWEQLEKMPEQGLMGAKLAVIEADKLLDMVLKSMFMPGETLGERLKVAAYKYPKLNQVWSAHKLRNQLVHDSSFEITTWQARAALIEYRRALKILNVV
jgi:hypothetical protein